MTGRQSWRRVRLGFGLAAIGSLALACSSAPLHIANETDIPVSVFMGNSWIGTYAAGASGEASISGQGPPRTIEVRSPSGAVLMSVGINDAQLEDAAAGGYGNGASVGLPCGVVTVMIGTQPPNSALAPAEAIPPGPCP